MRTAYEYWMTFPKHDPPKDVDIAEAMSEYASYYLWAQQPALKSENDRLREERARLQRENEELKAKPPCTS